MSRPLVIGHRGAPGYRPEHTRSSYELALECGVDAVEPDVVVSRDGVLLVRHDTEIGSTTDIAERPEFAHLRTTKIVDGQELSGWFAEDLTWAELQTLRCRERLPQLRPGSARFDGAEPILSLRELLDLVAAASRNTGRTRAVILEVKHATFLQDAGFALPELIDRELAAAGWRDGEHPLIIESFEPGILDALRARGIMADYVLLFEDEGAPADLIAADGPGAASYAWLRSPAGLDTLGGRFDGISLDKCTILAQLGDADSDVVADAHDRGLRVFTWTCRPENIFLDPRFRTGDDPTAFGDYQGEWGALRDIGVDGVFVDHADLGMQFFG